LAKISSHLEKTVIFCFCSHSNKKLLS